MAVKHREDFWINELAGALADPFIVSPGGWGADTPAWLKEQATLERMVMVRTGEPTGTDAEAAIYLMSASLEAPLDHDWAEIYLWVARKALVSHGTKVPGDLIVEKISDYQMGKLNHLKRWIYERRVASRVKVPRQPESKTGVKPHEKVTQQQNMFDFKEAI